MAATSCTIVVADASVVIDFLRINRVDLLAGLPLHFTLTDHVAHEVSDRYPNQRKRLASAFDASTLSQIAVTNPEELTFFGSLNSRTLLTGDARLRQLASDENIICHGLLWLIDPMFDHCTATPTHLHEGLFKHP